MESLSCAFNAIWSTAAARGRTSDHLWLTPLAPSPRVFLIWTRADKVGKRMARHCSAMCFVSEFVPSHSCTSQYDIPRNT
eukprot:5151925-Pyramimonas_sp.AAC.2